MQPKGTSFDILWGTMMPIMVRLGTGVAQIVARGSCTVIVSDPQVFEAQIGDPANLQAKARPLILNAITDSVGEACYGSANLDELKEKAAGIAEAATPRASQPLLRLGVALVKLSVDGLQAR